MGVFHYLNVNDGDCSIIQHASGRVTVFDCSNARLHEPVSEALAILKAFDGISGQGNFNQKAYPVNPIGYMHQHGINSIFRFILSHPEMDHMDGIKDLFAAFRPANFWDIRNNCEKDFKGWNRYREEDWKFYLELRGGKVHGTSRKIYDAGDRFKYFNMDEDGTGGADGLNILAPTPALAAEAIRCGNYNDASYVVLYKTDAGRILLCGDIHDKTMEHVTTNHRADVEDLDLLIAPHHGRDSDRSYEFLNVMRPKMTFFGNAPSEHLAYAAWNNRGLQFITNNQADCMVVDTNGPDMELYVTNERFARRRNSYTFYSDAHKAWFVGFIRRNQSRAA